ncbi:MAG: L,D-transpeptidase [Nocardioidaceae bacterium]
MPPGSGSGKRIVYDISDQHTWLVGADDDKVLRHYPVSGGLDVDLLEPGRYRVYSESRHAVSFDLRETMNFMVRFAHGDNSAIGFHDIPEHPDGQLAQSRQELGTPLSAGCIRQWKPDARALFRFADIDTLVVVTA